MCICVYAFLSPKALSWRDSRSQNRDTSNIYYTYTCIHTQTNTYTNTLIPPGINNSTTHTQCLACCLKFTLYDVCRVFCSYCSRANYSQRVFAIANRDHRRGASMCDTYIWCMCVCVYLWWTFRALASTTYSVCLRYFFLARATRLCRIRFNMFATANTCVWM